MIRNFDVNTGMSRFQLKLAHQRKKLCGSLITQGHPPGACFRAGLEPKLVINPTFGNAQSVDTEHGHLPKCCKQPHNPQLVDTGLWVCGVFGAFPAGRAPECSCPAVIEEHLIHIGWLELQGLSGRSPRFLFYISSSFPVSSNFFVSVEVGRIPACGCCSWFHTSAGPDGRSFDGGS